MRLPWQRTPHAVLCRGAFKIPARMACHRVAGFSLYVCAPLRGYYMYGGRFSHFDQNHPRRNPFHLHQSAYFILRGMVRFTLLEKRLEVSVNKYIFVLSNIMFFFIIFYIMPDTKLYPYFDILISSTVIFSVTMRNPYIVYRIYRKGLSNKKIYHFTYSTIDVYKKQTINPKLTHLDMINSYFLSSVEGAYNAKAQLLNFYKNDTLEKVTAIIYTDF